MVNFKRLMVGVLAAVVVLFPAFSSAEEALKEASEEGVNTELLLQAQPYDVVYGSKDAPVTVTEYASLSCTHCADFYSKVFSRLDDPYIKTGKVRFVYRHFPLNNSALRAAMLVECLDTDERKKTFIKVLFQSQSDWAYGRDFYEKLEKVAKIGGVDEETFRQCTVNKESEDAMLTRQLKHSKELKISSTPTIFINKERYPGAHEFEEVSRAIELQLEAAEK